MFFIVESAWKLENTSAALKMAAKEFSKPMEGLELKGAYFAIGQNKCILMIETDTVEAIANMHWPFLDHVKCKWYPVMSMQDAFEKIME